MSTAESIERKLCINTMDDVKNDTHTSSRKISDFYIGNLCTRIGTITQDAKISLVSQMIQSDPTVPGFCVIVDNELIGVATRNQLNAKLSSQYGYSLYCNREIELIMCKDFLCVDFFTTIDIVVKIAINREPEKIYDFITVTKGGKYFGIVTVKDLLERSMHIEIVRAASTTPENDLPGHSQTNKFELSIAPSDRSSVLDFDIDNFEAYNEVYGSDMGDMVMERLSQILIRNIPKESFLGHGDDDDFIAISQSADVEKICRQIVEQFEKMSSDFYSENDLKQGYFTAKTRHGIEAVYPLMSIAISGLPPQKFVDTFEVAESTGKIKSICK